jgi:hypothetical protein
MADTYLTPATLPMTPHDYLRRRRLLAGKTIEQAARPHWHRPEHRADCELNIASAEQEGDILKPWEARSMTRSFSMDPDVYAQLQELPMYHPTLCRCCGSTDMEPRETWDGFSARIMDDLICAACHEEIERLQSRRRAA